MFNSGATLPAYRTLSVSAARCAAASRTAANHAICAADADATPTAGERGRGLLADLAHGKLKQQPALYWKRRRGVQPVG